MIISVFSSNHILKRSRSEVQIRFEMGKWIGNIYNQARFVDKFTAVFTVIQVMYRSTISVNQTSKITVYYDKNVGIDLLPRLIWGSGQFNGLLKLNFDWSFIEAGSPLLFQNRSRPKPNKD